MCRPWVAATAFLVLLLPACGGDEGSQVAAATGGKQVETAGVALPSQILGLVVKPEDVSKLLKEAKRPFVDSVGLFSLRENDLVRATLQVSRFNFLASPKSPEFRSSIIDQLGSRRPERVRVGETLVYVTFGNEQHIFAWFEGRGFFILTAHQNYEFPRTLLRRLLELKQDL